MFETIWNAAKPKNQKYKLHPCWRTDRADAENAYKKLLVLEKAKSTEEIQRLNKEIIDGIQLQAKFRGQQARNNEFVSMPKGLATYLRKQSFRDEIEMDTQTEHRSQQVCACGRPVEITVRRVDMCFECHDSVYGIKDKRDELLKGQLQKIGLPVPPKGSDRSAVKAWQDDCKQRCVGYFKKGIMGNPPPAN